MTQLLEHDVTTGDPVLDGTAATPVDVAGPSRSRRRWGSFRGSAEPCFTDESKRECAELLDHHGIAWEYQPITFVLEIDGDGRVSETFRPDFYLPDVNLFLEVTSSLHEPAARRSRRVRRLRQRHPDVNVRLILPRDVEALGRRLGSRGAGAASVGRPVAG